MQQTDVTLQHHRQDQLKASRELIEVELERTTRDLANATDSQLIEGTLANHLADEASDMLVAEINVSRIREMQAEIRDIDDALGRIARGVYGICQECGTEIEQERLDVLPLASRCSTCQARSENPFVSPANSDTISQRFPPSLSRV